ncbi:hypothetical protein GF324_14000 [bacterium]|nr:hypothetical protein [bacterium]
MARPVFLFAILILAAVLAGCASRVIDPRTAYQQGKYEAALEYGIPQLEENPDDDELRRIVGEAAFSVGDTFTAVEVLKPMLDQSSTDISFRVRIADAALVSGHLMLARELYTSRLSGEDPEGQLREKLSKIDRRMRDAKALASQGDSLLARDEWARAAGAFQKALKQFAAHEEYRAKLMLAQAEILADNEDPAMRERALLKVVEARKIWKNAALTWWIEGDVLMKLRRYDQGVEAMQKALEMGLREPYKSRAKQYLRSATS